jgi:uncharacterized integral membrane protein (TIGR00698 family)
VSAFKKTLSGEPEPAGKPREAAPASAEKGREAAAPAPTPAPAVPKWRRLAPGVLVCLVIALPAWYLGQLFPLVGGPVFAILIGMIIALGWRDQGAFAPGVTYSSKKILQYAVITLGFGLNLGEIAQVGSQSLPIIVATIATSLVVAFAVSKALKINGVIATLIGVGSSICGGSAVAATAPVIDASDEDIAQAISVIFLFNVLAALIFPTLGQALGLSTAGFGLFAGTAVNDTSSVTAAAAAWDGMHPGANALDIATIVKLTRTLAIIPITLVLAVWHARKARIAAATAAAEKPGEVATATAPTGSFSLKKIFPTFILWFLLASVITTVAVAAGVSASAFAPLKTLSKFLIVVAMAAIGLNTNLQTLIKKGGKPILLGFTCWVSITVVALLMQRLLGIW